MTPMVRNILIGVGALVVVAGAGYGVYSFMNTGDDTVDFAGQTLQSADICNAVLAYSAEIGVVPPDSSLAKETTTSGDADNRRVCSLEGGGENYAASVDLKCPDMHNPTCIDLYKVTGPKDAVLYQRAPA